MSDFTEKFAEELRENKTVIDAAGLGFSVATGSGFGMAVNGVKLGIDIANTVKDDFKDAAKAVGDDFKELGEALVPEIDF